MTSDLERRIQQILVDHYTDGMVENPAFDRNVRRATERAGLDYDIPAYLPGTLDQLVQLAAVETFTPADGIMSFRFPRLDEIARIVADGLNQEGP